MKVTQFRNSSWKVSLALILSTLPAIVPGQDLKITKSSQKKAPEPKRAPWADFIESDFPFFSSVLDARELGEGWPTDNLTPRGIILPLGNNCWVCFDTDLLRVSAIWQGKGVSPVSMSQGSYHVAGVKAPEGQDKLPEPLGRQWLVNGTYPGWQIGDQVPLTDPRPAGPDKREVGRGPINPSLGRFKAIHLNNGGAILEYEVAGTFVQEWWESQPQGAQPVVQRCFSIGPITQPLTVILGRQPTKSTEPIRFELAADNPADRTRLEKIIAPDGLLAVRVLPSPEPFQFRVGLGFQSAIKTWSSNREPKARASKRWTETVTTRATLSPKKDAYVIDNIALPLKNPWKRNVRLADLAFFPDGRAAAVTFDGDVWMISGLRDNLREVRWRRFTSGLHEPLGICVRRDELFIFDRNGIWRLRDIDGDGEADAHELFSNAFAQTAETREFAAGLRVAPDGSFIIAKGGQQGSTSGIHNGSVLRISADGKSATVPGWGLRQPFIGVNPKTGLITASDQQGHYVPATPLHIIEDRQFYGFPSPLMVKESTSPAVAQPLTWLPHTVNASGAGQAWLTGARMGSLNDELIHIGYYRPEVFLVLLNHHTSAIQSTLSSSAPLSGAAVLSLSRDLEFAPLNGAVNPVDGQLYLTGFQIWGTTAKQVSGLARLRFTGAPSTLPREVQPMDKGILLRFDKQLDVKKTLNVSNYSLERWNYQRTKNYGSPHFKLDGTPGQEVLTPSSAYLSRDRMSVFVGVPNMKPVMQMRFGWSLVTADGMPFNHNAYFTVQELPYFEPTAEGFESLSVDLSPRTARAAAAPTPVTAKEGERLAALLGCTACHSSDGSTLGKVGPSWKGLYGSEVVFTDGSKAVANDAYLRESIAEPTAKILRGFDKSDAGMPSYKGVITDSQVEALIVYIKALK